MRKVLTWTALIIAVLWVINNPGQAAALAHHLGHALATLAAAL